MVSLEYQGIKDINRSIMLYFDMRCYERLILFALGVCVVFVNIGNVGSSDMSVSSSDVEGPAVMSITEEVQKAIIELEIPLIEEQVDLVLNKIISCKDLINIDDLSREQRLELRQHFSEMRGKTSQKYWNCIGDIGEMSKCDPTEIDNRIVEDIFWMVNNNIIPGHFYYRFWIFMLNVKELSVDKEGYIAEIECLKCLFKDFKTIVEGCKQVSEEDVQLPTHEESLLDNIKKLGNMSGVRRGVSKNVSDKVFKIIRMIFCAYASEGKISDEMTNEMMESLLDSINNQEDNVRSPDVVLFYDVMSIFALISKDTFNFIKSNSQLTQHFEGIEDMMTRYMKVLDEKLQILQSNDAKVIEKAKTRASMIKLNLIGELLQQRGVSVSVAPVMAIVEDDGAHP